jgi:hypothetical protein
MVVAVKSFRFVPDEDGDNLLDTRFEHEFWKECICDFMSGVFSSLCSHTILNMLQAVCLYEKVGKRERETS